VDSVLRLADKGLCLIPIRAAEKIPHVRWRRYQAERPSEGDLRRWWGRDFVGANVAVVLGSISGNVAIRDFDDQADYDQWAEAHHSLCRSLPVARTKRGAHVFFRAADPECFGVSVVRGDACGLPAGELRLTRCFSLVPPSVFRGADGSMRAYEWLRDMPAARGLPLVDPVEFGFVPKARRAPSGRSGPPLDAGGLRASSGGGCGGDSGRCNVLRADVARAVRKTQPSAIGERNACVGALVRELSLCGITDPEALRLIGYVWHMMASPVIGTKDPRVTIADMLSYARTCAPPSRRSARARIDEPPI